MVVAKEGDCVGHHPDVATATVIVRFVPLAILLSHGFDQKSRVTEIQWVPLDLDPSFAVGKIDFAEKSKRFLKLLQR